MAITIRELLVKIGLDVDAQSFAKGQIAVDLVRAGLSKIIDTGAEVARSFVEQIQATAEYGHELERTSQIVGLTTDELQRLNKGASVAGVGVDSLSTGLRFLSRNMSEAKQGGEEQAKVFAHAGVAYKDSTGKLRSAGDVITDVSTKFAKMEDGAEKTALAMQLFGRGGAELIPMLNLGGAELEKIGATANIISEEQIKAGVELVRTQKALEAQTKALWRGAVAPLLPAVTDLLKQFLAWKKANNEILKQRIKEFLGAGIAAVRGLGKAFQFAIEVMQFFKTNWIATVGVIIALTGAWALANQGLVASFFATQVAAVSAAASAAAAWATAAAPIALAALALGLVLIALDDIRGFFAGEDSLIGRGIDRVFGKGESLELIREAGDLWDAVKEAITEAWEAAERFYRSLEKIGRAIRDYNPYALGKKLGVSLARATGLGDRAAGVSAPQSDEAPYGPAMEPTGAVYAWKRRAEARRADARFLLPADVAGPQYRPSAFSSDIGAPASASAPIVNNTFHVTQLPGESGEALARRVAGIVEEQRQAEYSAAAAALPAVQ